MTKSDNQEIQSANRPFLGQILLYLGVAAVPGALASLIAIGMEEGFDWTLLGIGLAIAAVGVFLVRYGLKIGNFDPPNFSTKAGLNQTILIGSAAVGLFVGLYFNLSGRAEDVVEGGFVLTQTEAIAGLVILGLFAPIAWFWHRIVDEHEAAAANGAAIFALYVYLYGYVGWTFATYAGLLPQMNDFVLFASVISVFCVVWAFRRSG